MATTYQAQNIGSTRSIALCTLDERLHPHNAGIFESPRVLGSKNCRAIVMHHHAVIHPSEKAAHFDTAANEEGNPSDDEQNYQNRNLNGWNSCTFQDRPTCSVLVDPCLLVCGLWRGSILVHALHCGLDVSWYSNEKITWILPAYSPFTHRPVSDCNAPLSDG